MDHFSHDISHYMPHGHCYLWEPWLVGTHVVSDTLIGVAYLSISISLYLLIKKIRIPFSFLFVAFGIFIGACGLTHFMEVWTLWTPDYWMSAMVKVVTALASVATAVALFPLTPKVVAFAEAAKLSEERGVKLEAAYADLELRVKERTADLEAATIREREARQEIEVLYTAAQAANRLKDDFLATLSHELRTPLSVILGYSEILADGNVPKEEAENALQAIRRNAKTQSQLVNDLLDVSMIISGKMQLKSNLVVLQEPVLRAIESMSLAAKAKEIEIQHELPLEEIFVFGDDTRLQQITWNLISNAVKFTPEHGKITVTVGREDNKVLLQVVDNGAGIDASFLPYVFERFRQEDASSTRKFSGLGLGLGIVKNIVELHGGTVIVTSKGKGHGTTFSVRLPMAAIQERPVTTEQKSPDLKIQEQLRNLRVLVVDDELDVRQMLASMLRKEGLVVHAAANAEEALRELASFHPQVIVCDIGMPGTDGYALIRLIRNQEMTTGEYTPAIALTAYAQEEVRKRVLSAGFQSYLAKPAKMEDILQEILGVISH
jgi:signal transduction histidine kinase/CheY-like chemotaxis protein